MRLIFKNGFKKQILLSNSEKMELYSKKKKFYKFDIKLKNIWGKNKGVQLKVKKKIAGVKKVTENYEILITKKYQS